MPYDCPEREPRKPRLLRLLLLQIAILSIANGCTGGHHGAFRDEPSTQPAPRQRYVEARFVPTELTPREHTATSRIDSGRLVVETEP